MLKRHRPSKIFERVVNTNRCSSDDDYSQSTQKKLPAFASVHRITRHHSSKLKYTNDNGRDVVIQKPTKPTVFVNEEGEQNVCPDMLPNVCSNATIIKHAQRAPLYKCNTEKGLQQTLQQQQQLEPQQQHFQNAYLRRNKTNLTCEKEQHQQQQQQRTFNLRQRSLHTNTNTNTNNNNNNLDIGNALMQQHNHLKRQHQHQHQQQQLQSHIMENSRNNLHDIYKRNSLNQTIFLGQETKVNNEELKQQHFKPNYEEFGKQMKQNCRIWSQPPIQKSGQSLPKLSNSSIVPIRLCNENNVKLLPIVQESHLECNAFSNERNLQFSDSYDEIGEFDHIALRNRTPPPPPAPLNHLYETIRDRPHSQTYPRPLPPTPTSTLIPISSEAVATTTNLKRPPPLPPTRLVKKTNGNAENIQKLSRKSNFQSNFDKSVDNNKKSRSKSFLRQSPETDTVTAASRYLELEKTKTTKLLNDYNIQQRTKADGEQKYYINQLSKNQNLCKEPQSKRQHLPRLNGREENGKQQSIETEKPEYALGVYKGRVHEAINDNNNNNNKSNKKVINISQNKSANDSKMMMRVSEAKHDNLYEQHNCANILEQCNTINTCKVLSKIQLQQKQKQQQQQQQSMLVMKTKTGASQSPQSMNGRIVMPALGIQQQSQQNLPPSLLPVVIEEDLNEFQHDSILEGVTPNDGDNVSTAKLPYRHGEIEVRLETAQAMAAAAYYARAAQKLAHSKSVQPPLANGMSATSAVRNGGFCGALQRAAPPMPSSLVRRLANKENYALGKVKVLLRVSDSQSDIGNKEKTHFMSVDKKKRQITLTDSTMAALNGSIAAPTTQERAPMVAAPKMFAFDHLFTAEDQQMDVCASALSDVIPAVLEGSDGCLLTVGYPNCGQSQTFLGTPHELGAIPCAISWLYKGINERRQKSGARFSVRVSALGVSPTKPDSVAKDLLVAHATDSDDSPGIYLCDDFLGGPTELRAPTAERAALFLDAALTGRSAQSGLEPAMIFTLHVYQYSLSRKGGVAGGRSRLHLIDLGGCANRSGGLPLSSIGNILLAILSGQRHPPNKDHPLTPLLKDCLAPMTCHVAIVAHVMHKQTHTDALTTIQLASRIHRLRRRKHRYPLNSGACGAADKVGMTMSLNGHQAAGSSAGSGADPSSSELSADTVIYMGPSDDATDGEHPPAYLPSLSNVDNREILSKVLKNKQPAVGSTKKYANAKVPAYTIAQQDRTSSLKRVVPTQAKNTNAPPTFTKDSQPPLPTPQSQPRPQAQLQPQSFSPAHTAKTLTNINSSPLRHVGLPIMCSKASNIPTPKNSPLRRPSAVGAAAIHTNEQADKSVSPKRLISEECWVDGPRISRAKVAEARHLLREVNHIKQCETWIDGPKFQSSRSLTTGNLPNTQSHAQSYGFMDSHKKSMIRQWVEYQTSQVFHTASVDSSPTHTHRNQHPQYLHNVTHQIAQLKQKSLDNYRDLFNSNTPQQHQQQQQHQQHQQQLQEQKEKLANDRYSLHNSHLDLVNTTASYLIDTTDTINHGQNSTQLQSQAHFVTTNEETNLHSTHSLHNSLPKIYGPLNSSTSPYLSTVSVSDMPHRISSSPNATTLDCDEDQDSGPSEVPPALPLIEPLGSREISHESLHHILSRHISRESLYQQQQKQNDLKQQEERQQQQQHCQRQRQLSRQSSTPHYSQQSIAMSDCCLQVTEEDIARTMATYEHPLAALSHCDNISIVSSFHVAGDAFSDSGVAGRTSQFDQLARLHEIFTSQLAMAEVTPVFRPAFDLGSVYSEPAYRYNAGPSSLCSEPPYRPPSPRIPSRSSSRNSLPSLNGIMQIAGMEQYASLRHPDGASDPNLQKLEKSNSMEKADIIVEDKETPVLSRRPSLINEKKIIERGEEHKSPIVLPNLDTTLNNQSQLPLLPLTTSSEAYDSGHDSSTPRTSKHSGISRRAESGYHSVATARDSDDSSFTSGLSKDHHHTHHHITAKRKQRQEKGLCTWLMNPFTCTYGETEGEISDF